LISRFWALDQSEGPSRIRLRLRKETLKIPSRFILPRFRPYNSPFDPSQLPLSYLTLQNESDKDYEELMTFPSIKSEIQYMRFCSRVIPGEEIPGEIILSEDTVYFIPESNSNKTFSVKQESLELPLRKVNHALRRRYTLEEKAIEIFVRDKNFLFVFKNTRDREEFYNLIQTQAQGKHKSSNSTTMSMTSSLMTMTTR
jgi:PH domain associated with Beige/BEACH